MKKTQSFLLVAATGLILLAGLWATGLLNLGRETDKESPSADVSKKGSEKMAPHELIVGKWEGTDSKGRPAGLEFTDKGIMKVFPFAMMATYKVVDDTLETEVAFGVFEIRRSKIVVTKDELTIDNEKTGIQKYKRVQQFSIVPTKPAPKKQESPPTPQVEPTYTFSRPGRHIVFSSDSRLLASTGSDNTVRLWEVATGKEVSVLKEVASDIDGYKARIDEIAIGPDGKKFATRGTGSTIKVWDVDSQTSIFTMKANGWGLAFSPDGKRLVAGTSKYEDFDFKEYVMVWDILTGKEVLSLRVPWSGKLTFSPDGKLLAHWGRQVTIWNTFSKDAVLPTTGGTDKDYVTFHFGSSRFAAIEGFDVVLYDLATGRRIGSHESHNLGGKPSNVTFSPGGKRLAVFVRPLFEKNPTALNILDVETGKKQMTLVGGIPEATCLAFSPDGKWLASGGKDNVCVWSVASNDDKLLKPPVPVPSFPLREDRTDKPSFLDSSKEPIILKHKDKVSLVAFDQLDKHIISISQAEEPNGKFKYTISICDRDTVRLEKSFEGEGVAIALAVNRDGSRIAVLTTGEAQVWDVAAEKVDRYYSVDYSSPARVTPRVASFGLDVDRLVLIGIRESDRKAVVREISLQKREGKEYSSDATLRDPGQFGFNRRVIISPDGKLIAVANETTTEVWNVEKNNKVSTFASVSPLAMCFSEDGKRVIWYGLGDSDIVDRIVGGKEIYKQAFQLVQADVASGTQRILRDGSPSLGAALQMEGELVRCLAISKNGTCLAVAAGNTVRIWQIRKP